MEPDPNNPASREKVTYTLSNEGIKSAIDDVWKRYRTRAVIGTVTTALTGSLALFVKSFPKPARITLGAISGISAAATAFVAYVFSKHDALNQLAKEDLNAQQEYFSIAKETWDKLPDSYKKKYKIETPPPGAHVEELDKARVDGKTWVEAVGTPNLPSAQITKS
jgi:hypothetical protein